MNEPVDKASLLPALEAPLDQFYIPATESLLERRTLTLKHGDTFGVFDRYGDIRQGPHSPEGLYHNDTRYLSSLKVECNGLRPLFLSSKIEDNNATLSVDLANPDLVEDSRLVLPRDMVHIVRSKFLWRGACYERLALRNYDDKDLRIELAIRFAADFADIFEVRGQTRPKRGKAEFELSNNCAKLIYHGLDNVTRRTIISFDPPPAALDQGLAHYALKLAGRGRASVFYSVRCAEEAEEQTSAPATFFTGMRGVRHALRDASARAAVIETSNQVFNEVLRQAMADVHILLTDTEDGPVPYAGVPWFSTIFGRDALITAIEMLWVDPAIAEARCGISRGYRRLKCSRRPTAEPGKIIHEVRHGEMARLGEVPFAPLLWLRGRDALFVMLAGAYLERTGDLEAVRSCGRT